MTATMSFLVKPRIELAPPQSEESFTRWFARHLPDLIEFRSDPDSFGNFMLTVEKRGLRVRFAADRGTLLVSVSDGGGWHRLETVWAFIAGRMPADGSNGGSWPEYDPFEDDARLLQAIKDPALVGFEHAADRQALERIGFAID